MILTLGMPTFIKKYFQARALRMSQTKFFSFYVSVALMIFKNHFLFSFRVCRTKPYVLLQ